MRGRLRHCLGLLAQASIQAVGKRLSLESWPALSESLKHPHLQKLWLTCDEVDQSLFEDQFYSREYKRSEHRPRRNLCRRYSEGVERHMLYSFRLFDDRRSQRGAFADFRS